MIPTMPNAIPFLGGMDELTIDWSKLKFTTFPADYRSITIPDGMDLTQFAFHLYDENEARKKRIAELEEGIHDIKILLQRVMKNLDEARAALRS